MYTIRNLSGIEIISYFDAPYNLVHQFQQGKILLGYDFLIHIPEVGTLPIQDLSENFSNKNISEKAKIERTLFTICNLEAIKEYIRGEYLIEETIFRDESLKFLLGKKSKAFIGYELIYK